MNYTSLRIAVIGAFILFAGAANSHALSYVGFGGGYSASFTNFILDYTDEEAGYDTVSFGGGFSAEAQFGWEINRYTDMEGALRYHDFSRTPVAGESTRQPTGFRSVGFEGGIRLHPERGFTNSSPYLRLGIGSYSPSIQFDGNVRDVSSSTVLGYYVGIGYTHEITGKLGVDLRASMIQYSGFSYDIDRARLQTRFIAISAGVIIF